MKIFRVTHSIGNQYVDLEVADDFQVEIFWQEIAARGVWLAPNNYGFIATQWIQSGFLMTHEQRDALNVQQSTAGMTKQ